MVISRTAYLLLVAALALERLGELWLSRRNARALRARGGHEVGRGQYRVMVVFHTLFIVACFAGALNGRARSLPLALSIAALIGTAVAQILRYWSIATLGQAWNTRVFAMPHAVPIVTGPYRFIRHPNYLAVILEIICVPLIYGLVLIALVFSVGNGFLLAARIALEERTLGAGYRAAFASRPRFLPRPSAKP